jgi:hypothetical protein
MSINPKSLSNLKPGANKKNAVRVTLTLKPETVKLLRMTGNMSQAVDKFIELIKQGCVQHDGMLNPLPRSEPEKIQSQDVNNMIAATALTIVDRLLQTANHGQKLNNLQSAVFLETWAEHSYSEIAQQLGYEYDYIKQVGSQLWQSLSQVLGEPVSKQNVQAVLRRYEQSHYANNVIETTVSFTKPTYWTQVLTRRDMIQRGFSAYWLDSMRVGTAVRDEYDDRLWWKEAIGQHNESLRPLGSRADVVWCR